MYLGLTSASRDPAITRPVLDAIAEALELQLYRDYAPLWDADGCAVRVYENMESLEQSMSTDVQVFPLVVYDEPDKEGVLGWHSRDAHGRGYGRAFWSVIRQHGGTLSEGANSLSVTLSHEALEMVGDPYVNWWADTDSPGEQECLELCDRTQGDHYDINGIAVSNFLGPRAFRSGRGPYDLMRLLRLPWEIRAGGYAIRRKASDVFPVWGANFPEWVRELKMKEGSRTFRRCLGG